MLPGMSKFRQHNVYRDWEFEKADEDLPSSLILDQDPDDRLSEGGRARKKRRIEDHGFNFIKGRPIYIQSARMRGPFGASWVNPWLETGTLARNEGKGTRGKEGGARPPELRESGVGRGGAEESKNREPRVKPSRPVPARKVSPIEGSDIPPQPHMLSASHPVHRRQSSNASDRTLDWLRQQKAHRHTPEQNDDSFFALGPTPSRPPRSSISRPNISDRMGTSKSSGQKGSRLRKMPSDSAGHKQGEQYRSSGSVDAQRETDIDHAENVDTPTHNKADKKRIATSRGMVLRDDPAPFAVEVMQTSIVKAASVSKAKRSEPPMSSANVLQPRIQNKSLLISKVVSESNVFKPSVNEDMVHGDVEQGVKRSRALSHKSTDEAGLIVAKPLIQKATEHILKPPGADDTIHHPHEEPELISRANSEGRASVARHLTRSAVQQSAERCGTHVSRRKSSSSQKRHEINKTVAVATTKEAMNLLSTNPPKAVNTRLQHLKHPHNASPLTSRDSPGFAYRRVSIHGQDSPTHAEESALIGADGGPHLIAAQSKIGDELIGDLPTGARASYQDGSAAEADSPVFGTGGVARSATGPKSEMQQGHRRQTPLEEMDVDKMTPAQRWAFIERYTNREIPDDGDSPTNKNSTRARLRRAMRASGASFMTVDNDEKGITDAEVVQKSPSGESSHGHPNLSGASLPYHQAPQAPSDTNLSTQAAFFKAHQTFQDDLQSLMKPNTPSATTNDKPIKPPTITPFRELNSQLRPGNETPEDGALSTQAMLDQAAGIAFSTVKKPKAKKRASFAVELEKGSDVAARETQEGSLSKPTTAEKLTGFFNFLAEPSSQQDVPLRSGGSVTSAVASSAPPVPSWPSSSAASGSARQRSSAQDAQRQQSEVEAEALLDDATSFLEPWSLEAAMRA